MGTRERRDRERGELRSLIMDTARRLFAAEGYYAVSMRRIADAIEYSPAAIYVHFKDKEALIRELCTEDFGKLAGAFLVLAKERDPIQRIRKAGHLYIRFAVEHPNHYRLMFMTPMARMEPSEEKMQRHGDPEKDAFAFLLHSVNEALLERRFLPNLKDAQLLAQTFWAIVHGVASLQITMGHDQWIQWADIEQRATVAIDGILQGITRSAMPARSRTKAGK